MSNPTPRSSQFKIPSFKNTALFEQAMTHRSYAHEKTKSGIQPGSDNERLEFLGDCVLNFVTGDFLYEHFPDKAEGELTTLRAALVNEAQVAAFANAIGLGQYLKLGVGAERDRSRDRASVLSSTFEALIGAYYLDCDGDIESIRIYLEPVFESVVPALENTVTQINPKSQLQNWAQIQHHEIPEYKIIASSGPDHSKTFTVDVSVAGQLLGRGRGLSKQIAEKLAAQQALKKVL
jgi:ribonuclease-3